MRLDHIAYRVQDRDATVEYLENVLKYTQAEEFEITFSDNSKAMCVAMTPPEKPHSSQDQKALSLTHGSRKPVEVYTT